MIWGFIVLVSLSVIKNGCDILFVVLVISVKFGFFKFISFVFKIVGVFVEKV